MRLLVAEDQKDLNDIITKTLIRNHYTVDSCFDGEEALDYLEMAEYDAVILDIMMPKKNGLEVLKALRASKNTVPVLLLTARDSISDRVTGLDAGADDYLIKPFAFEELLARIRAMLRKREGRAQNRCQVANLTVDFDTRTVMRDLVPKNFPSWNTSSTTRESCCPETGSNSTSGITTTKAAPTWWTCTSVICAKRSTTALSRS